MRKIDMHCHILPGLDDGATSLSSSIQMIKIAKRQNIKALIATPHYSNQFQNDDPEKIKSLCNTLEQKAQEVVDPRFRIFPGQEIFNSEDIVEKLKSGKALTMAGSDYVLVEFLPSAPYSGIFRAIQSLILNQYMPILAHVERYGVLREKGRIEELRDMGAYMQVNYRSVGGKWYEEKTRWCRKMLKEGNIHFLGTDMHNTQNRSPDTLEADLWMDKHLEASYIKELSYENPRKIIKHEKI